jgi:hypothetical protein
VKPFTTNAARQPATKENNERFTIHPKDLASLAMRRNLGREGNHGASKH